jgi:hypothetical protein
MGTVGIGLIGLYNRTVQMFCDCTNLSLSYSAVRKLSDVYENSTADEVAHYVKVTRSIALLTGIAGMLLFIIFSPLVMEFFADGGDYSSWYFVLLSPVILFMAVSGGEVAVMATELAEIIASRLDQIVKPLLEMLNKEASRFQILYVTGGGAMLQGIIEYLQARTPIQVMYGSHASWLAEDTEEDMYMPSYSALVGTLLLGANYREKHPMATSNGKGRLIDEITNTLAKKTLEIFSDQNY